MRCPICENKMEFINSSIKYKMLYCCVNCADDRHNVWSWFYVNIKTNKILDFKFSCNADFGVIEYDCKTVRAMQSFSYPDKNGRYSFKDLYNLSFNNMDFVFHPDNENTAFDIVNRVLNKVNKIISFQ